MSVSENVDDGENIFSDYLSVTLLKMDFTTHVLERTNGNLQINSTRRVVSAYTDTKMETFAVIVNGY